MLLRPAPTVAAPRVAASRVENPEIGSAVMHGKEDPLDYGPCEFLDGVSCWSLYLSKLP